uniref:VCBS domain-containing protein n=2 Tax=Endozoicomonas acroporae TaxID=1701104 RepID=UPI0013D69F64
DQKAAIEAAFSITNTADNTNNGSVGWDYRITEAELDFLGQGETIKAVFTVTVDDGNGGKVPQDVTVTITGTNDLPEVTAEKVAGAITEGSMLTDSGSLTFTDVDLTDRPQASEATKSITSSVALTDDQKAAIEAAFSITNTADNTNNGSVGWDYRITEAELDFLGQGETIKAVFTVTVDDGNGGKVPQDVTVTINGANDKPLSTNDRVRINEDEVRILRVDDFGTYSDAENDALTTIKITSLSDSGSLEYQGENGWEPVTAGQEISVTDINGNKLRFIPNDPDDPTAHESGDQYATIKFKVSDGNDFSESDYELVIDVTPVADQPGLQLDENINNSADSGLAVPPPPSTGLLYRFYDELGNGPQNVNGQNASEQEVIMDNATPTEESKKLDGFGDAGNRINIDTDDSYAVTGLIYLEAGKKYTFSGYHDDLMRLEVGGAVLFTTKGNSWGNYTTDKFIPSESGYYTLELYVHNASHRGAFSLNVAVDGGSPQALTGANFHIYASVDDLENAGGQFGNFVSGTNDGGYFPIAVNTGAKNTYIEISNINAVLIDDDGSEIISEIMLSGIPARARLWDGSNISNLSEGISSVNITDWDLSNIRILPPPDFTGKIILAVSATSQEQANKDEKTIGKNITVTVHDPAGSGIDADILKIPGDPDNTAPNIDAYLVQTSGSGAGLIDGSGTSGIDLVVAISDQDGDTTETTVTVNFTAYQTGDNGSNALEGTEGSDYLAGGAGDDTLKGDPDGVSATDVFAFNISDLIDGQTVQTDTLLDFALGKPDAENGDILDISGLVDLATGETLIAEILGREGISASYDEQSQIATISFTTSNDESSSDSLKIVFSNTTGWSDLDNPGNGIDGNDVLQQLINNGQLIV